MNPKPLCGSFCQTDIACLAFGKEKTPCSECDVETNQCKGNQNPCSVVCSRNGDCPSQCPNCVGYSCTSNVPKCGQNCLSSGQWLVLSFSFLFFIFQNFYFVFQNFYFEQRKQPWNLQCMYWNTLCEHTSLRSVLWFVRSMLIWLCGLWRCCNVYIE